MPTDYILIDESNAVYSLYNYLSERMTNVARMAQW